MSEPQDNGRKLPPVRGTARIVLPVLKMVQASLGQQVQPGNDPPKQTGPSDPPHDAHVFDAPGTYVVPLEVQNANGDTSTTTVDITVTDPPYDDV